MKTYLSFGLKKNLENFVASKTRLYQVKWSEISYDRLVEILLGNIRLKLRNFLFKLTFPNQSNFP